MILKNFQLDTVEKLLSFIKVNFNSNNHRFSYLSSPTGSGKTVILANLLKKTITSNLVNNFFFIWISPHPDLLLQSKKKVEKIVSSISRCKTFTELGNGNDIQNQDILFINWDLINRSSARLREDREDGLYLDRIFYNVRNADLKPILIVDESHKNLSTDISKQIIEIIKPKLSIYVSATPNTDLFTTSHLPISVNIDDVVDSGLIKKSVIIDDSFKNEKQQVLKSIIDHSVKKRKELEEKYKAEGLNIKPISIIQLPNINSLNQVSLEDIIQLLSEHKINVENRKLALYFSKQKTHESIDDISNDDNVEFVIFKIALAQGWDCPRAQILVLLRDVSSYTLTIQTLGRIIRLPRPELGFRKNEALNNSYLITNLSNLSYEDNILNYINKNEANLKKKFYDFQIKIFKAEIVKEKNLDLNFDKLLNECCHLENLLKKIKLKDLIVKIQILSSTQISNIDKRNEISETNEIELIDEKDIKNECDSFIFELLSGKIKSSNSVGRIKTCIYNFLENEDVHINDLEKVIADKENRNLFEKIIRKSVENFSLKKQSIKVQTEYWSFPKTDFYGEKYEENIYDKNVYDKFYLSNNASNVEKSFIKYLNTSDKIKWWFKNGDQGDKYFYILYDSNQKFYCDFIFSNGRNIFIVDTKSGQTIDTSAGKLSGMLDYLDKIEDDKNLINDEKIYCGIISNLDSQNYSGAWVINNQIKLMNQSKINDWQLLENVV